LTRDNRKKWGMGVGWERKEGVATKNIYVVRQAVSESFSGGVGGSGKWP
jgi:hypothetical protein